MEYQRISVKIETPILEVIDTLRRDAPRSDFFNYLLTFYLRENRDLLLLTTDEINSLVFFRRSE